MTPMLSHALDGPDKPIDKPAWCRAGFHCWKINFRMITCAIWRCEWCGKRKVMSR